MSPQRPGVRQTKLARELLDRLVFDDASAFTEDIAGAQAYALLGLAEAIGEIALSLRQIAALAAPPVVTIQPDDRAGTGASG